MNRLVKVVLCFEMLLMAPFVWADKQTELNPLWHQCKDAGDCTVVRGFCGYPEAVNHQYRQEYVEWMKAAPPAACALLKPPKSVCITCQEYRCFAKTAR